jgi:asparagine synthase (glutamine-hydrolysing)
MCSVLDAPVTMERTFPEAVTPAGSPMEEAVAQSLSRAVESATRAVGDATLLFSGGLDSSLLAWLVPRRIELELLTIGSAHANEFAEARRAAELVGRPWRGETVSEAHVRAHANELGLTFSERGGGRSVLTALSLAIASSAHATVLCGQGADELFFGYAHFRGLEPEAAHQRRRRDLEKLLDTDLPVTSRRASDLGYELQCPFTSPELVRLALRLPFEAVAEDAPTKPGLRRIARHLGLPDLLAARPKRAIQFGSGIDRILGREPDAAARMS